MPWTPSSRHDYVVAILLAAGSTDINSRGVTKFDENRTLEAVTFNAHKILTSAWLVSCAD
ncbi:hypothetical protein QZG57_12650 [Corynebacterium glucuronolyticum]|uniref:hypothetical protein n=1 Tax=Corynebacterium glucuronolyticum TaxID=39791 RepID=UPI003F6DF5B9